MQITKNFSGWLFFVITSSLAGAAVLDANLEESVFIKNENIRFATSFAWAPDGSNRLFVTRQYGEVRIIKNGQVLGSPFVTFNPIHTERECGLLGICFDPNFAINHYIYFFVTVSAQEQQIIRYTDSNDSGIDKTTIVRSLPTRGRLHNGGALGIGPDGKLYWAIGDNGAEVGARDDLRSLASKVGRANLDGTVPNDNPFVDGDGPNNDYIWARGFRNPFTLAFQPVTGKLWLNVVGALSYDQIFIVNRGDHGGWDLFEGKQPSGYLTPVIKYRINGTDTRAITRNGAVRQNNLLTITTAEPHGFLKGEKITLSGVGSSSFNGDVYVSGVSNPTTFSAAQAGVDEASGGGQATTLNQGGSVLGGTFYDSTALPQQYWGNFFYGDYNSDRIMRATLDADNTVATVDYFISGIEKPIDISAGPDGALYYMSYNDSLIKRLAPASAAQNLIVYPTAMNLVEGGLGKLSVRLAAAPSSSINVSVGRVSGHENIRVSEGAALVFTPENWATPQIVTVSANVTADNANSTARLAVSSAGLTPQQVFVNAIDHGGIDLVLSASSLEVREGSSATFALQLSKPGSGDVRVSVSRSAGDADVSVVPTQTFIFTPANWATPQVVTIQAADDDDLSNDQAVITLASAEGVTRTIPITILDNDPIAPVIVSAPVTTSIVGVPYVYDVNATGLPAPTYLFLSSPSGMTIDSATGLITWTPSSRGDFGVSVQAGNGVSPNATQTFSISVREDSPPTAKITKPLNGEVVSGNQAEWFGDGQDDVSTVKAEFYIDDFLAYTDINNQNHFHFGGEHLRWDTTVLDNGAHRLKLVVYDTKGQIGTKEISVTVANRIDYEGDVAPRVGSGPDGVVRVADWVQIGRFAAGLDAIADPSEFLRADCAPRNGGGFLAKGNGIISVADWVQAGRYAVGLDPLTTVGGPSAVLNSFTSPLASRESRFTAKNVSAGSGRFIRVKDTEIGPGQTKAVSIELEAEGNENAIGFTIQFDKSKLRFTEAGLANGATGAAFQVNAANASNGQVGIVLALPAGQTFAAGKHAVVEIHFTDLANANGQASQVNFADQPIYRELTDAAANNLQATFESGLVTVVVPNQNPIAVPDIVSTTANEPIHFLPRTFLQNDTDPDGDSLTLSSVSSNSGHNGTVTLSEGIIFYEPPANFTGTDSFGYSVSDGRGGSGSTTVTVNIGPPSIPSRAVTATVLPGGKFRIDFRGVPGRTYLVQLSSDLSNWTTLTSVTLGANGVFSFEDPDSTNLSIRFYRIIRP